MKKLILILIAITAISCTTQRKVSICEKWGVCRTDSVIIEHTETLKDTIVKVERSEAYLDMYLECDSLGKVFIRSINDLLIENTNLNFKLQDGRLVFSALVPEKQIKIQYKFL